MAKTRESVRSGNNAKTVAGAIIGAIIGFVISGGNPLGAVKGALYGAQIGMMFGTTVLPDGPRLDNLSESGGSDYGKSRPVLYGTDVVPTNLIWMKNNRLQEFSRQEKVGKKQYQTLYSYSSSFALALGEGEIDEIVSIHANNILIYSDTDPAYSPSIVEGRSKENNQTSSVRFYRGDYSQDPDPDIVADVGQYCPAFRGEAMLVFKNFDLTNKYFNAQPTFRIVARRKNFGVNYNDRPVELLVNTVTFNGEEKPLLSIEDNVLNNLYRMYDPTLSPQVGVGGERIYLGSGGTWQVSKYDRGLLSAFYFNRVGDSDGAAGTWHRKVADGVIPAGNTETLYKVEQSYSPSYPSFNVRRVQNVVRLRYDTNTYRTENRGNSFATNRVTFGTYDEEVLRFYPFDLPYIGTQYVAARENVGTANGILNETKGVFFLPVTNTDDLFLIFWDTVSSFGTLNTPAAAIQSPKVGLAKIDGDRFVVHRLLNFNMQDYNYRIVDGNNAIVFSGGSTVKYNAGAYDDPTGLLATANYSLVAEYVNDKVYFYKRAVPTSSTGFATTNVLVIPEISKINWSWPVRMKQTQAIFDWNSFTFYVGGEHYIVDQRYLDRDNPNKLIDNWYVSDNWWTDLFFCQRSGNVYGMCTVNTATILATPRTIANLAPDAVTHTRDHFCRLDPHTLTVVEDYGNLRNFLITAGLSFPSDNHRFGAVSETLSGNYLILRSVIVGFSSAGFGEYYVNPDSGVAIENEGGLGSNFLSAFVSTDAEDVTDITVALKLNQRGSGLTEGGYLNGEIKRYRYYHTKYLTETISSDTVKLSNIVAAEFKRTGLLTDADFDVTSLVGVTVRGFTIAEQSTVADNLKALMSAYLFDIVEEDYKLKCKLRSSAVIRRTIDYTDLQAREKGSPPTFEIRATVPPQYKTPTLYQVAYRDVGAQYETGMQQINNPFGETQVVSELQLPVVMSSDEAYKTLEQSMRATQFAQSGTIEFHTTMKHSDLEASDWIAVGTEDGSTFTGRIIEIDKGRPGIVKIVLIPDSISNYGEASVNQIGQSTNYEEGPSRKFTPLLIDSLPFDSSESGLGFWFGAYVDALERVNFNFDLVNQAGVTVATNLDSQASYLAEVSAGRCKNALGATGNPGYIDYSQPITVALLGGTLATVTQEVMLSNEKNNTYFYGSEGRWEIIKVASWTDNSDGTYTGTGIIRGYKGTAHMMSNHAAGDFVYSVNGMLRAVADHQYIDEPVSGNFKVAGPVSDRSRSEYKVKSWVSRDSDQFLPPLDLLAQKDTSGDWVISWTRQSRWGIEWRNGGDATLDAAVERYKIFILDLADNDRVVRTIAVDQMTTATWTDAQQVVDFGSTQGTIRLVVQQVNDLTLATTDTSYRYGVPALGEF